MGRPRKRLPEVPAGARRQWASDRALRAPMRSPFRTGPLRQLEDVEWVTAEWVDWYNARRLHTTLGDVPPEEFEAAYYADLETPVHPVLAPA